MKPTKGLMDIWGNRWAAFIWVEIQLEKIKPMNDNRLVPIQYFFLTFMMFPTNNAK